MTNFKTRTIKKVKIVRDLVQDGVDRYMVQCKVLPKRDKDGNVAETDIVGGMTFDLSPDLLPDDFRNEYREDLGRPIDMIKGKVIIELEIDRAEIEK